MVMSVLHSESTLMCGFMNVADLVQQLCSIFPAAFFIGFHDGCLGYCLISCIYIAMAPLHTTLPSPAHILCLRATRTSLVMLGMGQFPGLDLEFKPVSTHATAPNVRQAPLILRGNSPILSRYQYRGQDLDCATEVFSM